MVKQRKCPCIQYFKHKQALRNPKFHINLISFSDSDINILSNYEFRLYINELTQLTVQ